MREILVVIAGALIVAGLTFLGIPSRVEHLEEARAPLMTPRWTPSKVPRSKGVCSVEISSPKSGGRVVNSITVAGTATIPSDSYLWILQRQPCAGHESW